MASGAKVTEHYLEWNSQKYFRGKAENVVLGCYGEKKDPLGANAYLAIQNRIKREHLVGKINENPPVTVDWDNATKADVEVNGLLKFFGLNAKAAMSASYEKAKSGHLELIKLFINEGPLTSILNQDAGGARNYLAEEGGDGQVVSEAFVLVDGELAEHFKTSTSITSSVSSNGEAALEITASGGTEGSQTIELGTGTAFAYLMHKVKKWNSDKTRIEDMEDDRKGMG